MVYFLHQKVIQTSAKMCQIMYSLRQSNTYLSKTVFNHHPFASIHWELVREESDCKAVSQDKVREAAEYCIALHLPGKKTKTMSLKHTVLKQATIGFFHWSISSKPSIKSPLGNGSAAATWLLESQIYYNNQAPMMIYRLLVLKFEVPSLME